ncbi:hypothetical protein MICRO11B_210019 [Micrococcus luteus]|nr:hypothetical protein MICRO11B_210019 [Micrococcus luteus]
MPQRGCGRRCAHPRQVRPVSAGRGREAHLRGHGDRPAEHAGVLRLEHQARGQARHHRLPQDHREPGLPRRPHPRLARPRLRGPVHLDRGPGADHRLHGLAHQPILLIPSAQARRPPVIDIHHSSKGNRTYGRERL